MHTTDRRKYHKFRILCQVGLMTTLAAAACSKKSSKSAADPTEEPTSTGGGTNNTTSKAKSVDDARVTLETSQLALAGTLSIVPPKELGSTALNLLATDFESDRTNLYVRDDSLEALDQAGGIYCFISQLGYVEMANKGPYFAQINEQECFGDKGGGSSDSPEGAVEYTEVLVDSVREPEKPLHVKIWFKTKDGSSLHAQLKVAEGVSKQNPIGIFRMEWNQGGQGGKLEASADDSGRIVVSMQDEGSRDNGSWSMAVKALLNPDDAKGIVGGSLATRNMRNFDNQAEGGSYTVAFNESRLLKRPEGGAETCLSRDEFDTLAWNYNLYDASAGSRIDRNSGFPIEYTGANGQPKRGHIGYHGLWTEDQGGLASGATVSRVINYDTGAKENYTVVSSNGKLIKNTRMSLQSQEIIGIPLNLWDRSDGNQYRIEFDGSVFKKTGVWQQTDRGGEWVDSSPTTYSLQSGMNHFHSDGLGMVEILMSGSTISQITITKTEDVTGSSQNLTLTCFLDCPVASITQAMLTSGDPNVSPLNPRRNWGQAEPSDLTNAVSYTFNSSDLGLYRNSTKVAFASGVDLSQSQMFRGGVRSGPMLPTSDATSINAFRTATVFYTWEMGQDTWNKFTGVRNSNGQLVNFDPPLQMTYTHSSANDADGRGTKFFGKTFRLNYGGPGQFWGIPAVQSERGFWAPQFSIKSGVTTGPNNMYRIKIMDGEQRMRPAPSCDGLTLANAPALPNAGSGYSVIDVAPAPDSSNLMVKVISGEVLTP